MQTAYATNFGTQSTGMTISAILGLLVTAGNLSINDPGDQPGTGAAVVQYSFERNSSSDDSLSRATATADDQLRGIAHVVFQRLLGRQQNLEPEIAELLYDNRVALYASF